MSATRSTPAPHTVSTRTPGVTMTTARGTRDTATTAIAPSADADRRPFDPASCGVPTQMKCTSPNAAASS